MDIAFPGLNNILLYLVIGGVISMIITAVLLDRRRQRSQLQVRRKVEVQELEDGRCLFNNAPCGYHRFDDRGAVAEMNDTELGWLGYQRAEVLGKLTESDLFTPEDQSVLREHYPIAQKIGWVHDLRLEMIKKDGERITVLSRLGPVTDEDGKLVGTRAVAVNISQHAKLEKQWRANQDQFKLLVRTVKDCAVLALDSCGKVVSWNETAQAITGYAEGEVIGRQLEVFYPSPGSKLDLKTPVLEKSALYGSFEHKGPLRRKDGSRFLSHLVITPSKDLHGRVYGFTSTIRDLTVEQETNEHVRKLTERLEHRVEDISVAYDELKLLTDEVVRARRAEIIEWRSVGDQAIVGVAQEFGSLPVLNGESSVRELVHFFFATADRLLKELEGARSLHDRESVVLLARQLRHLSSAVRFGRMTELCFDVEKEGSSESWNQCELDCAALEAVFDQAEAALNTARAA